MESDFEEELERGKEKIADIHRKAKSDQQELDRQAEAERLSFFEHFGLSDFPNLKAWPADLEEPEKILFKRFISDLKEKLPKIIPYVIEFNHRPREVYEASESDSGRIFFGQYLYTDFLTSALIKIPSFSSIKIWWEGRFQRENPGECEDMGIKLVYSYERSSAGTKMIYWEDEMDWDVVLVRAKEHCEPVDKARSKGFIELK